MLSEHIFKVIAFLNIYILLFNSLNVERSILKVVLYLLTKLLSTFSNNYLFFLAFTARNRQDSITKTNMKHLYSDLKV